MNKVGFAPRALVDYESAARWYHQQHPDLGRRFRHAVNDCIKRVATAPQMNPRTASGARRALLQRFPYALYYTEAAHGVLVVAIVHGRRHPDAWSSGFESDVEERDEA